MLWFSRAVPKDRRSLEGGKRVIQFSLCTSDLGQAKALARQHAAEQDKRWGILEPERVSDPKALAVRIGFDAMSERLEAGRRNWPADDGSYSAKLAERQADVVRLARRFQDGDFSLWEAAADRAIEKHGLSIIKGSGAYQDFVRGIAEASIDATETFTRRIAGEFKAAPRSDLVKDAKEREAARAKPGETIKELFEIYAGELLSSKAKRPAGIGQDRMVIAQFAEFVGENTAISAIGYNEAKAYVDALDKIPSGYKKRGDYRGLTVHQAIEKGQREGAASLSIITKQRYISTLSPFFDWLRSEKGQRRVTGNPFSGLHKDISKVRREKSRPPFTAAQIQKIIDQPLFSDQDHADDWRKWIPLICLFTGARIGEVAQLHVDDLINLEDIWCVEFRHDESSGQRTKNGKSRLVALHSTLLEIGILQFVDRQKKRASEDGNRQLFPDLKKGSRGQFGDEPSKWWRRYLASIDVKSKDDKDGFGSHSFRHTMADQMRAAGHLDQVFGPLILGHTLHGITGVYGEARQGTPKLSSSLIESVRFIPIERGRAVKDGKPVDFSKLFEVAESE